MNRMKKKIELRKWSQRKGVEKEIDETYWQRYLKGKKKLGLTGRKKMDRRQDIAISQDKYLRKR